MNKILLVYFGGYTEMQTLVSNESKFLKEAVALDKLILPSEIHGTVENTMVENSNTLKFPDNNPFKKRKCDETQLVQIESIGEQVLVATVENLDILCLSTPDNTPLEVLDKSARKRSLSDIHSDKIVEQVSGITEVEDLDILCINLESHGSVKSKPKKVTDGKGRGKTEKSKKSNGKSS
jgi:exonuclease-1